MLVAQHLFGICLSDQAQAHEGALRMRRRKSVCTCAYVQRRLVHMGRPEAVGLQSLRNHPQEDAQHHVEHCPITLHEVAQSLWDRQHLLAHRQAGEDMIAEVCRRLHSAEVLHEGHTPRPLQE